MSMSILFLETAGYLLLTEQLLKTAEVDAVVNVNDNVLKTPEVEAAVNVN